jgi:hypothetical protein
MNNMSFSYFGSKDVVIANGATTSSIGSCGDMVLVGIITPSALTGTSFTVSASYDGVNFSNLYNTSGAVTIPAGASRYISLSVDTFFGVKYLKLISSGAEAAERTIKLVFRGR